MLVILSAGIAPGLALLSYFYLRDQYEHEPILSVFKSFIFGAIITFPIMFIQHVLEVEHIFTGNFSNAFIAVGLLEEFVKWFILYFTIFQHSDFNEPYDGVVYGVSVSLGFATLENILYLFADGIQVAFGRALLPVSSHALFGVIMGYYMGRAKFSAKSKKKRIILLSLLVPYILHALYDYILLAEKTWIYYMVPFMLFLWWFALRKVKHAHFLTAKHHEELSLEENRSKIKTIG